MKPECTPKRSQLEISKLADAYAAQEDALAQIDDAIDIETVTSVVEECSSGAQAVIDEYETAVEAMPALEEATRETIERLEEWRDALDGFSPDEPDDDADQSTKDEALDTAKTDASDLVNALEL
jgi:hypothetical protein